jgi:uncharacterized protein YigA (DUF484 family)
MSKSSNATPIDDLENSTANSDDDLEGGGLKGGGLKDQAIVDKHSVAKYLLDNPSFLLENPDLLIEIQVQLQENGVVSLTQLQAEQSRDKIKQLKNQLEQLVSNARRNELIYKTYAELNLDLARADSIDTLEASIRHHLVETLGLETAQVMLIDNNENAKLSEIQHRSIFDKKLAKQDFYFGRVGQVEKAALFPDAKAASVALIKLSENEKPYSTIGLLAIASEDPLHFQPGVDVDLIELLRKNLNFHIARIK